MWRVKLAPLPSYIVNGYLTIGDQKSREFRGVGYFEREKNIHRSESHVGMRLVGLRISAQKPRQGRMKIARQELPGKLEGIDQSRQGRLELE